MMEVQNKLNYNDANVKAMGFIPQKDIVYNFLLPYNSSMHEESNKQLAQLKVDLARWILLRDVEIAGSHWCMLLSKYIRIYGLRFSQEDHINFIHAIFSLLTNPGLSYSIVPGLAQILNLLLKKKELINPDKLTIDWKPLHKLVRKTVFTNSEFFGLGRLPENIEAKLKVLIKNCRIYFSAEATNEILETFRPYLCPFDMKMVEGMYFFQQFLPTLIKPELHDKTINLWFDELIGIWDSCQNEPIWEANLVSLLSRLANEAIGFVNWEPYIPKIFTRFLRSFNLPVGTRKITFSQTNDLYNVNIFSKWIVAMMSPKSCTQKYLSDLFKALKSFYHPSNHGKWTQKLLKFINKLSLDFVKRVQREREESGWWPKVPAEHRLTEKDVTTFVEVLREVAYLACFSKLGSADSSACLHHLAVLRPQLIIPVLMERTYSALETLIEPHRLIACLQSTVSVGRAMLLSPFDYPEGPLHILPLLFACLPGIDPNDIKKSLITFQLISTFATLVPLVDCSSAVALRDDLTENEIEVCQMTAQFEDFVLQFMDRVISLIEMSGHQHTRSDSILLQAMSQEESLLDLGIYSAISSILQQSSTNIFMTALDKVHRYTAFSIFETKVAGKLASKIVKAFVKVKPEIVLKKYVNEFANYIIQKLEGEDFTKDEHLDSDMVWKLQLLSEIVACDGSYLLAYQSQLIRVLDLTLTLRSTMVNEMAWNLLKFVLRSFTSIYALDYKCTSRDLDASMKDYCLIRDWGKSSDVNQLEMKWHVPSEAEIAFACKLLQHLLLPIFDHFKKHCSKEIIIEREDLFLQLNVILNCVVGASAILPEWKGDHIPYIASDIALNRFSFVANMNSQELLLEKKNIRLLVIENMRLLLEFIMKNNEEDTKSLTTIIKIYQAILLMYGTNKDDFDARWKGRSYIKKFMGHQLQGKKKHIRAVLVDRVQLQHELRTMHQSQRKLTATHVLLYNDLFQLATSSYLEIRRSSQTLLTWLFRIYSNSYVVLENEIIKQLLLPAGQLKGSHVKGLLHLMLGTDVKFCIAASARLNTLARIWPALVATQHCLTPSIHRIYDAIIETINKQYHTKQLTFNITEECCSYATKVLDSVSAPCPAGCIPTHEEILEAKSRELQRNLDNKQLYYQLIESLVNLVTGSQLMWKFEQVGIELIIMLMRKDTRLPSSAVLLFTNNLVHDSLAIRKISLSALCGILKQNKKPRVKLEYDPTTLNSSNIKSEGTLIQPGDRPDNLWVKYNPENVPKNEKDWSAATFVDKNFYGYYCWPKVMKKYNYEQQACYQLEFDDLDQIILDHLDNDDFLKKSLKLAALEENKGEDRFNINNYFFFKGLFTNYGPRVLTRLQTHVSEMVHDLDPLTHEANQRCASEIIAGLIMGAKYWHYKDRQDLWEWVIPQLQFVLNNLTIESLTDWGTCFATASEDQDPHKIAPLIELIMNNPINGTCGSFGDSGRLYVLQGVVAQQEWRIPSVLHRLVDYFKHHLDHHYKNVRQRIGNLLITTFSYDAKLSVPHSTLSPHMDDFILSHLLPLLQPLLLGPPGAATDEVNLEEEDILMLDEISMEDDKKMVEDNDKIKDVEMEDAEASLGPLERSDSQMADDRKAQIRLCKTVMKWIQGVQMRMLQSSSPAMLQLLPIFASLECEKQDVELRREVVITLACMARGQLTLKSAYALLDIFKQMGLLWSWQARQTMLSYMQLCVFYNLPILKSQPRIQSDISALVLDRLLDVRIEVRELAGVTLSGLLQCSFLEPTLELIKHFKHLAQTRLPKAGGEAGDLLLKRHAGILGISAIILAYPYEVPDSIPHLLIVLSNHLHDPQPIQGTVKATLASFKRTHTDSWHEHKQKFTEDQLLILTELLVSPNYYA